MKPVTALRCILGVAGLFTAVAWGEPVGRGIVLPVTEAEAVVRQCSRAVPRVNGAWSPTAADIRQLEADLKRQRGRMADACCNPQGRLDYPLQSYRQYAGVLLNGHRLIYVNAFRLNPNPRADWRTTPVIACDGDPTYWGVLYDPRARLFTQLAFNGTG